MLIVCVYVCVCGCTGGQFDVIVDDGGHNSMHILKTFEYMWPQLNPGGLYFIEDLHVQSGNIWYHPHYPVPADVIQSWILTLLITHNTKSNRPPSYHMELEKDYPLPVGLAWIFCQAEACVLGKAGRGTRSHPWQLTRE